MLHCHILKSFSIFLRQLPCKCYRGGNESAFDCARIFVERRKHDNLSNRTVFDFVPTLHKIRCDQRFIFSDFVYFCIRFFNSDISFYFYVVLSSGWPASYVGQSEVPASTTAVLFYFFACVRAYSFLGEAKTGTKKVNCASLENTAWEHCGKSTSFFFHKVLFSLTQRKTMFFHTVRPLFAFLNTIFQFFNFFFFFFFCNRRFRTRVGRFRVRV